MNFSTHFDRIGQWQQLYIFVPVSHFANDKQLLLIASALEDKEEKIPDKPACSYKGQTPAAQLPGTQLTETQLVPLCIPSDSCCTQISGKFVAHDLFLCCKIVLHFCAKSDMDFVDERDIAR